MPPEKHIPSFGVSRGNRGIQHTGSGLFKITRGTTGQGNIITDSETGLTGIAPTDPPIITGQGGLELNAQKRQPKTTNTLLPTSYKFMLGRAPHLTFFCQSISIPTIEIDRLVQDSPFSDIKIPAGNVAYGDLTLNFVVDEKLANWIEIYNWMTSLVPSDELAPQTEDIGGNKKGIVPPAERFSDLSVVVTTNQSNAQVVFDFKNAYPLSLGEIEFTSINTSSDPVTSTVTFSYDTYSVSTLPNY